MSHEIISIAIIGAGKLGITLAQLAVKAGYDVYISGSGPTSKIALSVNVLAPGAIPTTTEAAVRQADAVIIAVPLSKFTSIQPELLRQKLVIDAMNYWWEVDGDQQKIVGSHASSSEAVQAHFKYSHVVKAFSHIGYHDLHDSAKPTASSDRKAMAVAGDQKRDVIRVMGLVQKLGFEPIHIGALASGSKLEPGKRVFGANLPADALKKLLG